MEQDSSVSSTAPIHTHFLPDNKVGALSYNSSRSWLLSAGKGRFRMTDMEVLEDVGVVTYTQLV